MIAFTGLVFSITIVVLQLTSGQFSARVLRAFLRDRGIQFALGIFISTFVYAMVVPRAVTGSAGHHPVVPRIAVTGAFVLVLASVGLFVFYIHHVANMMLRALAADGRTVLVSSQQLAEIEQFADDVVIIAAGRVVATGTIASVTGAYPRPGGRLP
jgi:uncharacterized membrane protein